MTDDFMSCCRNDDEKFSSVHTSSYLRAERPFSTINLCRPRIQGLSKECHRKKAILVCGHSWRTVSMKSSVCLVMGAHDTL